MSDTFDMRMPIALSPLNILLMVLMLLAPYLGGGAKVYMQKKEQVVKLERLMAEARLREKESAKKATQKSVQKAAEESVEIPPVSDEIEGMVELQTPILANQSVPKGQKPVASERLHLFESLKKFARARDFKKAEETFLEHLESKDLSPMDSLSKYTRFQEMFQKLSDDYLSSSSNSI